MFDEATTPITYVCSKDDFHADASMINSPQSNYDKYDDLHHQNRFVTLFTRVLIYICRIDCL